MARKLRIPITSKTQLVTTKTIAPGQMIDRPELNESIKGNEKMKYQTSDDAYYATGSRQAYYDQFPTAKDLIVGKTYLMEGLVLPTQVRIDAIVDNVVVGTHIDRPLCDKQKYLFYATGGMKGWKYQDDRPEYRLQDIK